MPKRNPNKYDSQLVHRLPNEILVLIFSHFSYQHTFNEGNNDTPIIHFEASRSESPWVPIMLVCRRWNNLYSCTPSLWSTIPWAPVSWTKRFLEKSKNAPISLSFPVYLVHYDEDIECSVNMMLEHLHRTQDLYMKLEIRPPYWAEKTLSLPAELKVRTADALSTLNIDYPVRGSVPTFIIDDDVFAGCAPNVHEVSLHGPLKINWTNPIFSSNLTTLTLSHSPSENFQPAVETLVCTLDRVKLTLRYLTLFFYLKSFEEKSTYNHSGLVSLTALEEAGLYDSAPAIAHFLDYLLLPPLKSMGLRVAIEYTKENLASSLQSSRKILSTVLDPAHAAQPDPIPYLRISYSADKLDWEFVAEDMGPKGVGLTLNIRPNARHVDSLKVDQDQSELFSALASPFVRGTVKTVEIDDELPIGTKDWERFFEQLGGLEELQTGDYSSSFVQALGGDVGTKLVSGLKGLFVAMHGRSGVYTNDKFADSFVKVLARRREENPPEVEFDLVELDLKVTPELARWGDNICEKVANLYGCTVDELLKLEPEDQSSSGEE